MEPIHETKRRLPPAGRSHRRGKGKFSIIGIIGALGVLGVALFYNKQTTDNFVLEEAHKPAAGQTIDVRYIKKTKTATGKKRHADCYIMAPYKNQSGATVDVGCVKEYHKDAICALARCD